MAYGKDYQGNYWKPSNRQKASMFVWKETEKEREGWKEASKEDSFTKVVPAKNPMAAINPVELQQPEEVKTFPEDTMTSESVVRIHLLDEIHKEEEKIFEYEGRIFTLQENRKIAEKRKKELEIALLKLNDPVERRSTIPDAIALMEWKLTSLKIGMNKSGWYYCPQGSVVVNKAMWEEAIKRNCSIAIPLMKKKGFIADMLQLGLIERVADIGKLLPSGLNKQGIRIIGTEVQAFSLLSEYEKKIEQATGIKNILEQPEYMNIMPGWMKSLFQQ